MGYNASFNGELTPRAGKTETEVKEALKLFEECYENKDSAGVTVYEVCGNEKYFEEDYNDLANTFDGQVNFWGEDGARWSLFLKDGKVRDSSPFEIIPNPGETKEQVIGRYIAENGFDIRKVLEGIPGFIAAKLWYAEDVVGKMDEMGIDEEIQEKLLPEAVKLINKKQLEECDDGDWNAIEDGIKDALKKLGKEIKVSGITLLTEEEAKALPEEQREIGKPWWLRSPGTSQNLVAIVYSIGTLDYDFFVDYPDVGVRPALKISNLGSANLMVGDKFEMAGQKWTVINKNTALCDTIVGEVSFRKNVNAPDANDYEASDVKKWLEKWAKNKGVIA